MSNVTHVRQYTNREQTIAVGALLDTLWRFNICKMNYRYRPGRRIQVGIDE